MNRKRPYVICHMMATIDGKITSGTSVDILDDYFKLYTQTEDQLQEDSWMCGRITIEMFANGKKKKLPSLTKELENGDYIDEKSDKGYMITIDTKGTLRWEKNRIKLSNYEHELPIITIVSKQTPKEYLEYLREMKINYIFGGDRNINFKKVLEKLAQIYKIKTLLLEGGGILNGSLLTEDLIDEISLMIVPITINKSSLPTIFENDTDLIDTKRFELGSVKKIKKDCVWLRYHKIK